MNVPFTCPVCGSPTRGIIKVKNFNAPIQFDKETGELCYNPFDSGFEPGQILEVFCTNDECHWFEDPRHISTSHIGKELDELPY